MIALDGNPVPTPRLVDVIEIAPGERVDAIVEMNLPGVWVLGELRDAARQSGMGIVVEYANQAAAAPTMASASACTLGLHHLWHDRAASRARPDHRHGL